MIKTLIVEDEAFVAIDLQEILERLGHEVVGIVVSGEDALNAVRTNPPDLILMDVSLAGKLTGIETISRIRETHDMPVIYITAYSDNATIEPMKQTEPFEYMLKPFDERVLRVAIDFALHKARVRRERLASERLLATTLRSIGDAVITTDQTGIVHFLNPVAEALTGWSLEDARDNPLDTVFSIINEQTRQPAFNPVKAVLETGQSSRLANNTLLLSRDGSEYPIEDSAAPITDGDESTFGVVLVFRDITKRQQSELWLRQAQKLDSLGLLAGGIAHDFNNILGTISINTSMLREMELQSPRNQLLIERIQRASEQAAELTGQLLSYAGGQPLNVEILELNDTVNSTLDLVNPSRPEQVVVQTALCDASLPILSERSQIQQVLLNLILNSYDAMRGDESGGTLSLVSERRSLDRSRLDTYLSKTVLAEGEYAHFTIEDTGRGIDAAILGQIFDPFFSTKSTGSGLGLAATLGIIYQCNGGIAVHSEVGIGTSFTIILPIAQDSSADAGPQSAASSRNMVEANQDPIGLYAQNTEEFFILIADDQPDILNTLSDILLAEGYQTLLAMDGTDALELYQAHAHKIPLAILDIRMPTMNGTAALIAMFEHNPDLKAVLMTGHADMTTLESYQESLSTVPVLHKPFSFRQVVTLVQEILEIEK